MCPRAGGSGFPPRLSRADAWQAGKGRCAAGFANGNFTWIGGFRLNADAIINRILEDARTQAAKILSDANQTVEKLRANNEQALEQKRGQALAQARSECVELRDRMLRMAELDQRKEMLAMKREVVDRAFDKALEDLRNMPGGQACAFMTQLLVEAAQGDELLVVDAENENVFDEKFVADVNAAMRAAGKAGGLRLSRQTRRMGGGVVLSREGMEVNLTYPAVLSEIRPSMEAEIARMLFEER